MSETIFDGWIYDHGQYTVAFESLSHEIERVLSGSPPIVYPLLGDSRTGKSAVLADISARFESRVSASGHRQVLGVPMPSAASNEALAVSIIQAILGNIRVKGKTYQILNQARETMRAAGVVVLMIDEANHLVEKRSTQRAQSKENRQTADWIKELGDRSGISVVLAGLSHVSRLYSDNDQLENRGLTGVTMYPYAWSNDNDRLEFENTMHAGLAHMQANGWTLDISTDRVTRVAYLGSGGYIGKTRDFLVRIEQLGIKNKLLDSKLVGRSYRDKYKIDSLGDPLQLKSISDVLLNSAHQNALQRAKSGGRGH